jgi:hypothetical protein
MKTGTHNLGRNSRGKLGLAKVGNDELLIMVGTDRVTLDRDQAKLLKDILA